MPPADLVEAELRRRNTDRALKGGITKARKRCKTLAGFVREAWPILEPATSYVHGWHIDLICAHLEAITWGLFLKLGLPNRLIINIPPGMMKSLLVSVLWPAWEWGPAGMPHLRYLSTSHSDKNVVRDARKMRDLVESEWYQTLWPDVTLTRRAELDFANTKQGTREGRPFPSLTGGRGNRLLVDDPHSTETAEFESGRETAARIARESMPSRVNDQRADAIVVIMQRLHQGDVTGILSALNLGYIVICLPMRFEPARKFVSPLGEDYSDPRTDEGELLFPEFMPEPEVQRLEESLGAVGTAGQLQQRPTPRGGLLFKRHNFPIVDAAPALARRVRGWDFAASTKRSAAYSCGVRVSRDQYGIFYIEDVARDRVENPELFVKTVADQDAASVGAVEVDIPQDPGQAGKVQSRSIIAALAGYVCYATPESGDKVTRAQPVASQSEAGNIKVVKGPWNEAFFSELVLAPNSTFMDQIDAMSRAFARFVSTPGAPIVVPAVMTVQRQHFGDNPDAAP